jgi:hypothetical protein
LGTDRPIARKGFRPIRERLPRGTLRAWLDRSLVNQETPFYDLPFDEQLSLGSALVSPLPTLLLRLKWRPLHCGIIVERTNPNGFEGISDLTLRHELTVMDVKVSFNSAIKNDGAFSLAEFCTWPLLHQFDAVRPGFDGAGVLVKPDGFIRVHESEADGGLSEHTFFLELDRSTETLDTLVARAGFYGIKARLSTASCFSTRTDSNRRIAQGYICAGSNSSRSQELFQ